MGKSNFIAIYDTVNVKTHIPRPATIKRVAFTFCKFCLKNLIPNITKLVVKTTVYLRNQ